LGEKGAEPEFGRTECYMYIFHTFQIESINQQKMIEETI